jgi:hypothetical protein
MLRKIWKDFIPELQEYGNWTLSNIFSGIFLVLWVIFQYFVNEALEGFLLSGIDLIIFRVFQILFAITTLAPPLIYSYKLVKIMWFRANLEVEQIKLEDEVRQLRKFT